MDRVLSLATRLGQAVAEHDRCQAFRQARERFDKDEEAQRLQTEYDEAATVLREKMASNEPLEPEEKRRETDLRQQIASNETMRDLIRAQADFAELMRAINDAIEKEVGV